KAQRGASVVVRAGARSAHRTAARCTDRSARWPASPAYRAGHGEHAAQARTPWWPTGRTQAQRPGFHMDDHVTAGTGRTNAMTNGGMNEVSILLVEDHADYRDGLRSVLNMTPGFRCTAAGDAATALELL